MPLNLPVLLRMIVPFFIFTFYLLYARIGIVKQNLLLRKLACRAARYSATNGLVNLPKCLGDLLGGLGFTYLVRVVSDP